MTINLQQQGKKLIISGSICFDNAHLWLKKFDRALAKDIRSPCTIDLGQVQSADNSAVALMTTWLRHAKSSGIKVDYVNIPGHIMRVAGLYGVTELFQAPS